MLQQNVINSSIRRLAKKIFKIIADEKKLQDK